MAIESEMSGDAEQIEVSGRAGAFVLKVPLGDGLGYICWVERTEGAVTTYSQPVHVPEEAAPE